MSGKTFPAVERYGGSKTTNMIKYRAAGLIAALLLTGTLSSCIITNTPGFYSGYKKLSAPEKSQVVITTEETSVCSLSNDRKIYAITSGQLLKCLEQNDTSVVYFWSPNCHSDVCISLSAAQYYCDKKGYHLYVITEYYDFAKTNPQNTNPTPVLSVNHQYYKTDYCNGYMRKFTAGLSRGSVPRKNQSGKRFFFFKKGQLIATQQRLASAPES